jgi:signal transduction histidine kinase
MLLSKSILDVATRLSRDSGGSAALSSALEGAMSSTASAYGAAVMLSPLGRIESVITAGFRRADRSPYDESSSPLTDVFVRRTSARVDRFEGFPFEDVSVGPCLTVPILQSGAARGALCLARRPGDGPFDDVDEEVAAALAALAALGMAQARQREREDRRSELSSALRRVSGAVKDSLDLGEILTGIVEVLGSSAGVDRCYIRMVEAPGSPSLGPIEYEWNAPRMEPLASADIHVPIDSLAARTRLTQWSDDIGRDPRLRETAPAGSIDSLLEHRTLAVLTSPLEWGDDLLGAVSFHSSVPRPWADDDVTLIESASREIASALYHARVYEDALETVRELKELEERRSEYISMVSHEIRSPMTVIAGTAEILQTKRHRLPDKAVNDLTDSLAREAKRLARLVSEILDLERIDRGGMQLRLEVFDLVALATEAIEDTGEASRMTLATEHDELLVHIDRDKIKQVLINLMSNAAKFAPEGSEITISVKATDRGARVGVQDRGQGISETDQERLFRRFSRLDDTAHKPGTGLGLYLSRLIVERHGGRIWVESELGGGTIFYFELPRG